MDKKVELISKADWGVTTLHLLDHADLLIRRCVWRGAPTSKDRRDVIALADGRDASDFVQAAVQSVLDPASRRKWDADKHPDLVQYLASVLDSMVSNASRRAENRDTRRQFLEGIDPDEPTDILALAADPHPIANAQMVSAESVAYQNQVLNELRRVVADDPELSLLLDAYDAEITKAQEIEALTGIPAARVSELKRKLRGKLERIQPSQWAKTGWQGEP